MYYQALFKINGFIEKVSCIYKSKDECEEVAKAIVNSTNNWYYEVIENELVGE